MNIFILDLDPQTCAEYHCDKHVIKMILETAQLLCTTHWFSGSPVPYKQTHVNHPCSIWTRSSKQNYEWLSDLGRALCREYTKRYDKIHKSQTSLEWCSAHVPPLPDIGLTPFALAMDSQYKHESPVVSYRSYYMGAKKDIAKWKLGPPDWWKI